LKTHGSTDADLEVDLTPVGTGRSSQQFFPRDAWNTWRLDACLMEISFSPNLK